MELPLKITLIKPTPGVDFALQKGSGNIYESVQKQNVSSGDISFSFSLIAKGTRGVDAFPRLSGAFVQGPANGKFIYIGIGTYAGQTNTSWSRRLKIPLTGISWEMLDQLTSDTKSVLYTQVPGTGKDGGPNCATVKPFDGWAVG
ncbi:DUF5990 family protein [Pedobacter soli]|uniref:Uncharacterized protein n=1 Tax=Pedobacter soli TaxID=390242 RepID=A0A1G6JY21_9SPHI|nr:DUF5990 family protein [Pedobacter soli]SDC23305.1 hypothetical protein SAMN04488024_101584 [Pedobacter soli]